MIFFVFVNILIVKSIIFAYDKFYIADRFKNKLIFIKGRLKLLNFFIKYKLSLSWVNIKFLPVLPPDLRPLLKLERSVVIQSDFNFWYLNIFNLNVVLSNLVLFGIKNDFLALKFRFLQQSVDNLIDNSKFYLSKFNF